MRKARKQLAAGKVAGGPEQHDDVRRDDVHPSAWPGAGRWIGDGLSFVLDYHASMLPPGAQHQQDDTWI
jgi:hypothetical protein